MINPLNKQALIIDWDLAKYTDGDQTLESSQSGRSVSTSNAMVIACVSLMSRQGTWPFMSAKLLQLPKKPNELADDLESFIYVLCVMVLCYHDHTLSPTTIAGNVKEFTPEANGRNAGLSKYLTDTFYSNIVSGRYHFGGDHKLFQIERGAPQFKATDERLAKLISDLYKLLHEHYKAFPVEDLREEWGVVAPAAAVLNLRGKYLEGQREAIGFNFNDLAEAEQGQDQPAKPKASTPQATSPLRHGDTQFQGLNTHRRIRDIFSNVAFTRTKWPEDCDKTPSQFWRLPNADGTKGTEVASSLAGSSAGGSKHSLDVEEGDGSQAPKNKKQKRRGPSRSEEGLEAVRRSTRISTRGVATH